MKREFTPENITELKENEIFVFGSNGEGVHGKGAALVAKQLFGAVQGLAQGRMGQSYAIVTKKDWRVFRSSPLDDIRSEILRFCNYATTHPELKFYVTKLGSGLGGYTVEEIRELFRKHHVPENVVLPEEYEVRPMLRRESDPK